MHPVMADKLADMRIAELRREADDWRRIQQLRTRGQTTSTTQRPWPRALAALRRLRPSAA